MKIIDELKKIKYDYHIIDKIPCSYLISKEAEETIYFFAKQMNCTKDEALDLLLHFLSFTEVCIPTLKQLGYEFDPKKAP